MGSTCHDSRVQSANSIARGGADVRFFVLLAMALTLGACNGERSDLPVARMTIQGQAFDLEIARTPASREHGLMERDSMPTYHGMIFVFDAAGIYPFWMHYTRFPLDILWLSDQGQILTIATMPAYVETTEQNSAPALYVIELHAGMAQKLGLRTGMSLNLPPEAKVTTSRPAATAAQIAP